MFCFEMLRERKRQMVRGGERLRKKKERVGDRGTEEVRETRRARQILPDIFEKHRSDVCLMKG
jgi:hypothetical protein